MASWCCSPCQQTQQAQEIALEEQALMGQVEEYHEKA